VSIKRGAPFVIAAVVCFVVVAVGIATCGDGSDGPAAFLSHDGETAIFVQWRRVGDDVSGTISGAELSGGEVQRGTRPFTGTVRDDSVRLQIDSGAATGRVNGRLDGDTLELTIPQDEDVQTRRLTPSNKDDYAQAVQEIRDRERKREEAAQAAADREDRAVTSAVTPVATAFQKALDPASADNPCRYLRPQLKREIASRANANARSGFGPAGRSCAAFARYYESELSKGRQGVEDVQISDATHATVVWRHDPNGLGPPNTDFTRQNNRWLVDDCCKPGGF
jgi:hypothetical protein